MGKKAPKRLKAVIFDLDDTLVLSSIDFGKFKGLVIDRIVQWGDDEKLYSPSDTIVVILKRYEDRARARGMSQTELRRKLEELDRIMNSVELEHVHETLPIQGAAEVLRLLRKHGVRIGVLTRGCHDYANRALSVTRMADLVDELECRNSDSKPKPDPEAYLRLAAALGADPGETIFVGDHPIDAQCAKNAGVRFVAVMTGDVPEHRLKEAGSEEVFEDVGKMADWFLKFLKD